MVEKCQDRQAVDLKMAAVYQKILGALRPKLLMSHPCIRSKYWKGQLYSWSYGLENLWEILEANTRIIYVTLW